MYTNIVELAAWGDGHRNIVAQDMQIARYTQSHVMQRLVRMLNKVGGQIEAAGQRLQQLETRQTPQLSS